MGRVREVVRLRRLARIPDGKAPFRGLLSVRGDIVTVLDLAGLQERAAGRSEQPLDDTTGPTTGRIRPTRIDSVIVLRGGADALGLEVDGVEDIHDFQPREGEAPATPSPAPAAPEGGARRPEPSPPTESTGPAEAPEPTSLWAGTVRGPRGDVGVLDVDAVVRMAEALSGAGDESPVLEVGDRG